MNLTFSRAGSHPPVIQAIGLAGYGEDPGSDVGAGRIVFAISQRLCENL